MNEPTVRRLEQIPDLLAVQQRHHQRYPFLLDSAGGPGNLSRYSLLLRVDSERAPILAQNNNDEFFARLDNASADSVCGLINKACPLPFVGGWFLYLSYELAAQVEPGLSLPDAPEALPIAGAWPCPAALIIDHHTSSAWLVAENDRLAQQLLEDAQRSREPLPQAAAGAAAAPLALNADEPEQYRQAVAQIKDYILAGDVFQVNLSRAWRSVTTTPLDPFRLYRQLRQANPAPFAALCHIEGYWILSSSPERLVEVDQGQVQTRPIAGTRPRSSESERDRALGEELMLHPKERAEHVMLIDLERNDLGRVCQPGSIDVSELMVLESHAHVHHIVSNVCGRLLPGTTAAEVIKAVFPGGTITGCPKVRCMEIIAELERVGRGYYTGSLGYLSHHGRMDLNILIRTLLSDGQQLSFRTGAGIVADSDPFAEVEETNAKAYGLRLALDYTD